MRLYSTYSTISPHTLDISLLVNINILPSFYSWIVRIRNLSQINEPKLSVISLLNISFKDKKSLRHSLTETIRKLSSYSTEKKSEDLRRVIYGQYHETIHLLTETKNLRK